MRRACLPAGTALCALRILLSEDRIHREGRMILLRQEGKNLLLGHADRLICDHVHRSGMPISSDRFLRRPPISSLSILGIQTNRLMPPSPISHFRWVMLYLLWPRTRVTAPPPPSLPG